MTKIRSSDSSMIDDRRGSGGGGGGFGGLGGGGFPIPMKAGGGLLGLIVLLAALFLPKLLGSSPSDSRRPAAVDRRRFGRVRRRHVQQRSRAGRLRCDRRRAGLLAGQPAARSSAPSTSTPRRCSSPMRPTPDAGRRSSQTGPFYCPVDHLVYIDLGFMQALEQQLIGKPTDLAEQYIVAHEYGHHIQNLVGINEQVQQAQQNDPGPGQSVLGGDGAAGRLLRRDVGRRCRVAWAARLAPTRSRKRSTPRRVSATTASRRRRRAASTKRRGRTGPPSSARRGSPAATTPATRSQCDTFSEVL